MFETNPLGQKASYRHNSYGKVIHENNFSSNLQRFYEYDAQNRLIKSEEVDNNQVSHHEIFDYDLKDRLLKKTNHFEHTISYTYDLIHHQPIKVESPFVYDLEGKLFPVIKKASYDALGRKITAIDANGNTTSYYYNAYGSVTEINYPDQSKESFTYKANGQLDSHQMQNGSLVEFEYDVLGNTKSKSYFFNGTLLGQETFEYKGNKLLRHRDLENHLTTYFYDGQEEKSDKKKKDVPLPINIILWGT